MDGSLALSVSGFREGSEGATLYEICCGNTVTKQTWTVEQRFSAFDELRAGLRVVLQDTDADALRTLNGCFPPKLPFSRALGLSLTHSAKEERQQALNHWLRQVLAHAPRNAMVAQELLQFVKAPPPAPPKQQAPSQPSSKVEQSSAAAALQPPLVPGSEAAVPSRRRSAIGGGVVVDDDGSRRGGGVGGGGRRQFPEDLRSMVVVDVGSRSVKAGEANSSTSAVPAVVLPSMVGRERASASRSYVVSERVCPS